MNNAIEQAYERIKPLIRTTECLHSTSLSDASGAEVWLKLENRQLSGSFKLRGVANKLLSLSADERGRRLVAASTGNHGAAFAHVASELGLNGLLFLPKNAAATKLEELGGEVLVPKAALAKLGWTVLARDPQGNTIGLFEPDTGAGA